MRRSALGSADRRLQAAVGEAVPQPAAPPAGQPAAEQDAQKDAATHMAIHTLQKMHKAQKMFDAYKKEKERWLQIFK